VAIEIINHLKSCNVEDIAVIQTEFYGYSGEKPTLEIIIPKMGNVVFGNVTPQEAVELVQKYILDTEKIKDFLVDNDGNKKCNH
jgi:hypothetical protein